ncbi:unnamed protein product [Ranitomeya imitator]|uniref:Galectin n=1 Tax=Ranitomeya imitator TaxID=111125 RepID=A0ABN9MKL3_9NEOB|nr:unnamed protein product [Ranitomeya imitator]
MEPLCDITIFGPSKSKKRENVHLSSPIEYFDLRDVLPLKPGNSDLNLPLSRPLPTGLSEGQMILVRGLVTENPQEITLTLKSKNNIPFKLAASFKDESLYYNYSMGQSWGEPQQIQTPFFVFHTNKYFEILILPESGMFRLAINGTPLGDFGPPELDLKSIDELRVEGSALLYFVKC